MDRNPVFCMISESTECQQGLDRHVMCPCYDRCLDEAIVRNEHFSCASCVYKQCNIQVYQSHEGTVE